MTTHNEDEDEAVEFKSAIQEDHPHAAVGELSCRVGTTGQIDATYVSLETGGMQLTRMITVLSEVQTMLLTFGEFHRLAKLVARYEAETAHYPCRSAGPEGDDDDDDESDILAFRQGLMDALRSAAASTDSAQEVFLPEGQNEFAEKMATLMSSFARTFGQSERAERSDSAKSPSMKGTLLKLTPLFGASLASHEQCIQICRKMLERSSLQPNWTLNPARPGEKDRHDFDNGLTGKQHVALKALSAQEMLVKLYDYLVVKTRRLSPGNMLEVADAMRHS